MTVYIFVEAEMYIFAPKIMLLTKHLRGKLLIFEAGPRTMKFGNRIVFTRGIGRQADTIRSRADHDMKTKVGWDGNTCIM